MRNVCQVIFLTNAKSAGHWQARRDNYQVSSAKPKVGTSDYHATDHIHNTNINENSQH